MVSRHGSGLSEASTNFVNRDRSSQVDDLIERICEQKKSTYPRRKQELEEAKCQILARSILPHEKIAAFERSAEAIADGIKIFISYKSEDLKIAKLLYEKLGFYGGRRLRERADGNFDIFLANRTISAGNDFLEDIDINLREANWLIVLLPGVDLARDWLVYESGFFKAIAHKEAGERIIFIHHPDVEPADQFKQYQTVKADKEGIKSLFNDLFFSPNVIPGIKEIAPTAFREKIDGDAEELAALFIDPRRAIVADECMRFADVNCSRDIEYDSDGELLAEEVEKINRVERLFNRQNDWSGSFRQLIEAVIQDGDMPSWVAALRRTLNEIISDRPTSTRGEVSIPFRGSDPNDPGQYRPSVYCVFREGKGGRIRKFRLLFVEDFGGKIQGADAKLDALETAVHWSYRSWWEVFGRYRGPKMTIPEFNALRRYIERSEQEALSRGALDPDLLLEIFEHQPDKKKVLERNQKKYYSEFRNPKTKTGKIDRALNESKPDLLLEALREVRPMIAWLLVHGAKRYAEMLEEMLEHELRDLPPEETAEE